MDKAHNTIDFVHEQASIARRFVVDTFNLAKSYGIPPNIAVYGSVLTLSDDLFRFALSDKCTLDDILSIFELHQPDE